MTELPVFSPSATSEFAFCPRAWALKREGWRPAYISYPELCGVLGTGFSASMEFLNKRRLAGQDYFAGEVIQAGQRHIADRLALEKLYGRRIASGDEAFADKLPFHLEKAVEIYRSRNVLAGLEVVSVEQTFEKHGKARPDLIVKDALGLAPFDYKVKIKLWSDPEEEFRKYEYAPQQYHYCWMTGTPRYFICIVALQIVVDKKFRPGDVFTRAFTIHPAYAPVWYQDSRALWVPMQAVKDSGFKARDLGGNPTHRNEYGECQFLGACVEAGLDEARMKVNYIQIPKEVTNVQQAGDVR